MPETTEPEPMGAEAAPLPVKPEPAPDPSYIQIKRSHLYAALIPLAFAAGLGAGFLAWGRSPATTALAETTPAAPTRYQVSVDDDPSVGPDDAPVTIVEFSDFNCPYCKKFHQETFVKLMAAYGDQVRFVYRDFPITSAESFVAAQAANCAGRQGAYWAFHDALFSGSLGLGRAAYDGYAGKLGLNIPALDACLDSGDEATEVTADAQAASELGVTGTPTFFINGIPLVGAQPMTEFSRVIDSELGP
jgi:protein-disulfide isomerase